MKIKISALIMGLLCFVSAWSQSEALTAFNGRITFSGFANNGLYVRGTLKDFNDQTNQYIASQIYTNDIAWDNNGKRYAVVGVISSTSTQAVVDLSRIGGGTHIPKGSGFVSRETSNGLTLIPTANSAGISAQLLGRVLTHNAMANDIFFKDYQNVIFVSPNGNDSKGLKNKITAPFRTISAAVNSALVGDLVYVMAGVYTAGNIWKNGVNIHFESGTINQSGALFSASTSGSMRITGGLINNGTLGTFSGNNITLIAKGARMGSMTLNAGLKNSYISIESDYGPCQAVVNSGTVGGDSLVDNQIKYKVRDLRFSESGSAAGFYLQGYSDNAPRRNLFHFEAERVDFTNSSMRGFVELAGTGYRCQDNVFSLRFGTLKLSNFASSENDLFAFMGYDNRSKNNRLKLVCDDCEFDGRGSFSRDSYLGGFSQVDIEGRFVTRSKIRPMWTTLTGPTLDSTIRVRLNGTFISFDTTLFSLSASINYVFTGYAETYESDDYIMTIGTNVNQSGRKLLLKDFYIRNSNTVGALTSTTPTNVYVAGAFKSNTNLGGTNITFRRENEYGAPGRGASTINTDANGYVVITHNRNLATYQVFTQYTGTSLGVGHSITSKSNNSFTVRFYDTSTKAAIASTSIPFDFLIVE